MKEGIEIVTYTSFSIIIQLINRLSGPQRVQFRHTCVPGIARACPVPGTPGVASRSPADARYNICNTSINKYLHFQWNISGPKN